MKRWLIVVVLLLVAGIAAVALRGRGPSASPQVPPGQSAAAVPVEVATVTSGAVARTIEVSGTVTSARAAEVFAKQSGRVVRVLVQDGARVAAGQTIVELDASEQRAEAAQAQAAVSAAQARLAALESGPRPEERQVIFNNFQQAQNQVKAAETQLVLAQASQRVADENLRRHEQLLRDGAVAQAQVDQARLQQEQARAQVSAAQTQLEIAKATLDSARAQWNMTVSGTRREEIRAARAQVEQARAVLALTRQRVANMVIRAPFAGRVSGINASPGDYLVSGDFAGRSGAVALVYDDRALEAEVRVGERDLPLIKTGQRATLRIEGSDRPVAATVRTIAPAADPASRAATVRLSLAPDPQAGASSAARPGVFTRGAIVVEERPNALLVPKAAITGGDQPTIRVVVSDTVQVRPVTLGLTAGDRVEVTTGVTQGERVVVLGPEDLSSGTKVRVVNP
ncbi:MAG TPA: efflux RND transporter periplasmic adaptor subunit [bacterium]|nr:efflux RND transporter periplasmic adaptor subunit [bacterium]